jgi:hypothetical protein
MPYTGGFPEGAGIKIARGRWDFAVDGGAVSTIAITAEKIPSGAVILGGFVEVDTALTGAANAEAAVKVEGAADTVASAVVTGAPWSTTGRKSVIPAFTGVTTLKTTAARDISIVIAVAALTAGAFDVVLFYTNMGD